jgi:hypothetical protein
MKLRLPRSGATTTWMSAILMGLVIATVVLWTMVVKPPARARFEVGEALAAPCPSGDHAPVCYRFLIKNTGASSAGMQCVVAAAAGTEAQFLSDLPTYVSPYPLAPGSTQDLLVKVDATDGGTIVPPRVSCDRS